jgi:indolepyruvate ferredoxin oxidoreductase
MIALDDKYRLTEGPALLSGRQALVRLAILQRQGDRRSGLQTAGYISGYRGSPLGGYDLELWKAAEILRANDIIFSPGVNEDLALTAIAGTQQIEFVPGRRVEGVFAFWYGKGPGIDRSGDAIKHANLAGVSRAGGIVLLFGDDHAGKSSTTAHQSDLTLASWGVPVLYPASVDEIIELGLAAIALSRFSGLLVGLKLVNETADGSAVVDLTEPPTFLIPQLPETAGGVHIRPEMVAVQQQDARLLRQKLPRAAAFARSNRLDRVVFGTPAPRFLIATAGKAYGDVLVAMEALGIDEDAARRVGIGIYKIALLFPLDREALTEAAREAEEILFVEEKRAHAEEQAKALLYNAPIRPRVSGKSAPDGSTLLPADAPLNGSVVALALATRLRATIIDIDERLPNLAFNAERIQEQLIAAAPGLPLILRRPAFCPGCPHNLSTKVPPGSFGSTGIGCHGMAAFHADRRPLPMMHMGGEGANWIGLSRFVSTPHIFQNLGDGTYNHSGSLAIRAAVQAGTRITFKILFNDAVAMTGGQPVEGRLTVTRIVQQVIAEGVQRVVVVAEDPERFSKERLPPGTELKHRDALAAVQESLAGESGVSVLIYDQVCAAEKRRRRKAGTLPDPDCRIFINSLVCEGCGDCSAESNCLAIQPLETDLGTKRRIDQSACNKDTACSKGFCPSFVTISGARRRRSAGTEGADVELQAPVLPAVTEHFDILIAGIGGSGVVTVSAILAMAARIEGLGAGLYDMTGLSQKGGAVFSHVRLHRDRDAVGAAKIGPGQANVILACDLVASVHPECRQTISEQTQVFANADLTAIADFQVSGNHLDPGALLKTLGSGTRNEPRTLAATRLAEHLFGDSIAANLLVLGYAWQMGCIPLPLSALERAITLNGRSVAMNLGAFAAGRKAAVSGPPKLASQTSVEDFIASRRQDLAQYWNENYAEQYSALIGRVRGAVASIDGGDDFTWAVARSAYKLMAYKDEYEVARLYSDGRFRAALAQEFESFRGIKVHLAPPLLAPRDPRSGRPRKVTFSAWILPVLAVLARLKGLREGPFDIFARSPERRLERALRDEYLSTVRKLIDTISAGNLREYLEIARAPLDVRGYGHLKSAAADALLNRLLQFNRTTYPRE